MQHRLFPQKNTDAVPHSRFSLNLCRNVAWGSIKSFKSGVENHCCKGLVLNLDLY